MPALGQEKETRLLSPVVGSQGVTWHRRGQYQTGYNRLPSRASGKTEMETWKRFVHPVRQLNAASVNTVNLVAKMFFPLSEPGSNYRRPQTPGSAK